MLADAFASNPELLNDMRDRVKRKVDGDQSRRQKPFSFVTISVMVSQGQSSVPTLPIDVDQLMGHIAIPFGNPDLPTAEQCTIDFGVDSFSSLSIGFLPFFCHIIRLRPKILERVFIATPGKYLPITLKGIVDSLNDNEMIEKNEGITTTLPVLFILRTGILDGEGEPALLQVACGNDVAVNAIIGNSFLRKADATVRYSEPPRVELPGFEPEYLSMSFKKPKRTVPDESTSEIPIPSNPTQVFKALSFIERTFCSATTDDPDSEIEASPSGSKVSFGQRKISSESPAEKKLLHSAMRDSKRPRPTSCGSASIDSIPASLLKEEDDDVFEEMYLTATGATNDADP